MTNLPPSTKLPIEHLATCFNNVTNSYKFYWFLSILEHIKENQAPTIPIKHLLAAMVATVWYPTNYFRLSFGKQDRLSLIALFDKYPVSKGHALIISKQHVADYFELPDRLKTACWLMVDRVKLLLAQRFHPDGYNIGLNVGPAAGQTIPHLHIHLIPRYSGDVDDPTGGVRNVIPGKGNYLF